MGKKLTKSSFYLFADDNQLGTFSVNGEWACSPFVTKSGHADNPATFAPCVKSMAAGFNSKIHNIPHEGITL